MKAEKDVPKRQKTGDMGRVLLLAFFLCLFLYNSVEAAMVLTSVKEDKILSRENFIIRQERYRSENVFVGRPVSVDLRISNIISREDIRSLEDYAKWLRGNIRYRRDGAEDIWLWPDEVLTKKRGDCEDFAFLNAAVLNVLGYDPKVIAMVGGSKRSGHAICVFKRDGRYAWFDNDTLNKSKTSSSREFSKDMLKIYGYNRLVEISPEGKNRYILSAPAKR